MPELRHVDSEILGLIDVVGPPHFVKQLAVGDDPAGVANESSQELLLHRGEVNLFGAPEHLPAREVDSKLTGLKGRAILIAARAMP